jgi:hypothetical protein
LQTVVRIKDVKLTSRCWTTQGYCHQGHKIAKESNKVVIYLISLSNFKINRSKKTLKMLGIAGKEEKIISITLEIRNREDIIHKEVA